MSLSLPTVSVTPGPTYATNNNTAFEVIDAHDHTSGKGVPVPSSGININATLEFNDNGASELRFLAFTAGAAPASTKAIYVNASNDLYYRNASGTAVQITDGASVASVGSGVIGYTAPSSWPYAVTTGDAQSIIGVDTSSARTLTLPAASNSMAFWIKDRVGSAATNNITVTPNGADTIDTVAASWTINENFAARGFVSNGVSGWFVF
jgi:hypothetical protein